MILPTILYMQGTTTVDDRDNAWSEEKRCQDMLLPEVHVQLPGAWIDWTDVNLTCSLPRNIRLPRRRVRVQRLQSRGDQADTGAMKDGA